MAFRKGTITESGKKITWNQTETGISYSDGKTAIPTADNMDAKLAYKIATVVVTPPTNPIGTSITWEALGKLNGATDKVFTIVPATVSTPITLSGKFKNVQIHGYNKVTVQNLTVPAINLDCQIDGLKITGINFINIADRQVKASSNMSKTLYTGLDGSYFKDLVFDKMNVKGGGCWFHADGDLIGGKNYGVFSGFKILNSYFDGVSATEGVAYLGRAKNYEISGNITRNMNLNLTNDTRLFFIKGSGKVSKNNMQNHQGNGGRFWCDSIQDPTIKEVQVDDMIFTDNIVINSLKYGGCEFQIPDDMVNEGARIPKLYFFNNTVGLMNTNHDWEGQELSLYNVREKVNGVYKSATLEYYNNLGFTLYTTKNNGVITDMINNMSDVKVVASNNIYKTKRDEAINSDLSSKFKGVGASI